MSEKVFTFGRRIEGRTVYVPRVLLSESVPGQVYEIQMKTDEIPEDKMKVVAELLIEKLSEKFMAKVYYVEVGKNYVIVQLEGSPFAWEVLLAFLPEILKAVGVILIAVGVFLIYAKAPWETLMVAIGGLLLFLAPAISDIVRPRIETAREIIKKMRGEKVEK